MTSYRLYVDTFSSRIIYGSTENERSEYGQVLRGYASHVARFDVRDPNVLPWKLVYLAWYFPDEVHLNPALPLIAVEAPDVLWRVRHEAYMRKLVALQDKYNRGHERADGPLPSYHPSKVRKLLKRHARLYRTKGG
jgi:hypothetical protein